MGVPQRGTKRGWHHSRVIILVGRDLWKALAMHEGGLLSGKGKPRDLLAVCRLHPTRKQKKGKMHNGGYGRRSTIVLPRKASVFSTCRPSLDVYRAQILSAEEAPLLQMMQARTCHRWALFRGADERLRLKRGEKSCSSARNEWNASADVMRWKWDERIGDQRERSWESERPNNNKKNVHENKHNPHPPKKCEPRRNACTTHFKADKVNEKNKLVSPYPLPATSSISTSSPRGGDLAGCWKPVWPPCTAPAPALALHSFPCKKRGKKCLPHGSVSTGADGG